MMEKHYYNEVMETFDLSFPMRPELFINNYLAAGAPKNRVSLTAFTGRRGTLMIKGNVMLHSEEDDRATSAYNILEEVMYRELLPLKLFNFVGHMDGYLLINTSLEEADKEEWEALTTILTDGIKRGLGMEVPVDALFLIDPLSEDLPPIPAFKDLCEALARVVTNTEDMLDQNGFKSVI